MNPAEQPRRILIPTIKAKLVAWSVPLLCLGWLAWVQATAQTPQTESPKTRAKEIHGEPINGPAAPITLKASGATKANQAVLDQADEKDGEFIRLGFDKLSAFDYEVYEVYSETNAGRNLLKSDNVIPPQIKAYDGKRVTVSGFVMPLRTRNRLVTEFLLLRDQGTCCFGRAAKMNHYVRVKLKGDGFYPGSPAPYKVSGTLRVGETYVGSYLTGIYSMDAEKAVEKEEPPTNP